MNQSGKRMQANSYKPTNHRISIQHKKKCELKPMYSFNDEEIPLTKGPQSLCDANYSYTK